MDPTYAARSATGRYRTTPLRGLLAHAKGGYYHDGRFATLREVVDHYDGLPTPEGQPGLGLSDAQKNDLVEFLKSL